jgi:GNAT superfamily N-acetyltransferase
MSVEIVHLRVEDVPKCQRLSDEAGWNQNENDWSFIIGKGSAYGIWRGDDLIATAAIVPYGSAFGWVCMVLVAARERRQGLASRLLRHCVDELAARNMVAGLDATPAGREVYLRLGFSDIYPLTRFERDAIVRPDATHPTTSAPSPKSSAASVEMRRIDLDLLPAIFRYDLAIFGEDRHEFLSTLAQRQPALANVALKDGRVVGFVMGRDGRRWTHIGPLIADDAEIAIRLLEAATAEIAGPALVDVPDHHPQVQEWLRQGGFAVQRGYTRMLRGRASPIDDISRVMAIAGPEFG